jgi:hypothetical protein
MLRELTFIAFEVVTGFASPCWPVYWGISMALPFLSSAASWEHPW